MIHNKTEAKLHLLNFNYWNKTTTPNRQPQGVTEPSRSLTADEFSPVKESGNIMDWKYKANLYKSKRRVTLLMQRSMIWFYCQKTSDSLENHKNKYHPSQKATLSQVQMSYEMPLSW